MFFNVRGSRNSDFDPLVDVHRGFLYRYWRMIMTPDFPLLVFLLSVQLLLLSPSLILQIICNLRSPEPIIGVPTVSNSGGNFPDEPKL